MSVPGGAESKTVLYWNTVPSAAYLGSRICAGRHKSIYDEYMHTDMVRSMSLPSHASQLEKVLVLIKIFNKKLDRFFQVSQQGFDLCESEYELDPEGH